MLSTDDEGAYRDHRSDRSFRRAVLTYNLSYMDLKELVRNSIEYSFAPGAGYWKNRKYGSIAAPCKSGKQTLSCREYLENEKGAARGRSRRAIRSFRTRHLAIYWRGSISFTKNTRNFAGFVFCWRSQKRCECLPVIHRRSAPDRASLPSSFTCVTRRPYLTHVYKRVGIIPVLVDEAPGILTVTIVPSFPAIPVSSFVISGHHGI